MSNWTVEYERGILAEEQEILERHRDIFLECAMCKALFWAFKEDEEGRRIYCLLDYHDREKMHAWFRIDEIKRLEDCEIKKIIISEQRQSLPSCFSPESSSAPDALADE